MTQVNHMPLLLLSAFKKSSHRQSPAPSLAILIWASFTVEALCTQSDWINSVNFKKRLWFQCTGSFHTKSSADCWKKIQKKRGNLLLCCVTRISILKPSCSFFFFFYFFSSACLLLVSCGSFSPLIYISQKFSPQSSQICYLKKGLNICWREKAAGPDLSILRKISSLLKMSRISMYRSLCPELSELLFF